MATFYIRPLLAFVVGSLAHHIKQLRNRCSNKSELATGYYFVQ